MKDILNQIRELLNQAETLSCSDSEIGSDNDFSAFELPAVIQEIVDDLQPLLTPYDAAFYWYAFRHSVAKDGSQRVRLSTRSLQHGLVRSPKSDDGKISLEKVREALSALESIGALRKEGEPNREGTPYRVMIPSEIEACRKFRAERTITVARPAVAEADIDYYNVPENRIQIYERDDYKCRYCGKQLTRWTVTLDHVVPVCEGGDNSFVNLIAACLDCNSRKHRRAVGNFLAET